MAILVIWTFKSRDTKLERSIKGEVSKVPKSDTQSKSGYFDTKGA